MKKLKTVILAGGNGTRLFPVSRETSPKQFAVLSELGNKSLFQLTLQRAHAISTLDDIYVVASPQNYFHALIQSEDIGLPIKQENIIIQPMVRETLPIMALAAKKIGAGDILTLPSDHLITDLETFAQTIQNGLKNTSKGIINFGIHPTQPETGYGYIEKKDSKDNFSKVKAFHEKPDEKKAEQYIKNGYLWNAGIYLFDYNVFFDEVEKYSPEIKKLIFTKDKTDHEIFDAIEAVSFENAVVEKSDKIYCQDLSIYWTDLGSFDAIGDYMEENNINHPNLITEGKVENNIVLSESKNKEIALIDISDLVIVDSDDVLLISKRGSTQKVKQITKRTKKHNGTGEYRPWGSFKILGEGFGYKTKKITVLPGKKLSLQSHNHRSEHWVVVNGTAIVTIEDDKTLVAKGESVFVPIGHKHRLENPGKIPLIVIESQIGDYLEEDDIQRYDDDFGRN